MIFYFSGTGNTKWAAEIISKATNEKLFAIADEINGECRYALSKGERIGFCFPVHGWQPPRIVRDFISKIEFSNISDNYVYALCTCGDTVGDAMGILKKDINKKGWHLHSVFSIIMPESYVCLPFMYTDTKEKEREKIDTAKYDLVSICDNISNKLVGLDKLHKGATPWFYSYVIGKYFNNHMITDKKFYVDKNLCVSCGLCEKTCPTGNIKIKDYIPSWNNSGNCTCCLACYHHCPHHAINYGKITKKRGQYYYKG